MGYNAKVTSKGQITLPAKLREKLGLESGDHVEFAEEEDGSITISKKTDSFSDLRGIVKLKQKVSGEQVDNWINEARLALGTRR